MSRPNRGLNKQSKSKTNDYDRGDNGTPIDDDLLLVVAHGFFKVENPQLAAVMDRGRQESMATESTMLRRFERLLDQGLADELIQQYEAAAVSYPANPRFEFLQAIACLRIGNVTSARYAFGRAILKSKNNLGLLVFYVGNLFCAGQVSAALDLTRSYYNRFSAIEKSMLLEIVESVFDLCLIDLDELPVEVQRGVQPLNDTTSL